MNKNFDAQDNKILQDKVNEAYARHIAYKYLLKASKILKKNKFDNEIRKNLLSIISSLMNEYIGYICSEEYTFKTYEIQQLITVCMEILFQKIVVLYKSGIDNKYWNACLTALIIGIYEINLEYIKSRDSLKSTYSYIKHYSAIGYNAALKEAAASGFITKGQLKATRGKSYIMYLNKEIMDLMVQNTEDSNKALRSAIIFIVCLFVFKLILYYLKMPA